jgi:hypothetical protein
MLGPLYTHRKSLSLHSLNPEQDWMWYWKLKLLMLEKSNPTAKSAATQHKSLLQDSYLIRDIVSKER